MSLSHIPCERLEYRDCINAACTCIYAGMISMCYPTDISRYPLLYNIGDIARRGVTIHLVYGHASGAGAVRLDKGMGWGVQSWAGVVPVVGCEGLPTPLYKNWLSI